MEGNSRNANIFSLAKSTSYSIQSKRTVFSKMAHETVDGSVSNMLHHSLSMPRESYLDDTV